VKIDFFRHNIDESDIKNTVRVLKSLFLTTGDSVSTFEETFSQYMGIKHTIGVTSCTGALHVSLLAWGIGPGDEVIPTPLSFCATANSILQAGAKPVFVDVEKDTGNINAELIEAAITKKTKAIMPVHLYGQMWYRPTIQEKPERSGCSGCTE
jgi:dTDP-4-amino-4,6-dideoxygalactose transaminase